MSDNFLWDRSGEPDKDTQELESVLGTLRYDEPLRLPTSRKRGMPQWLALAAAAAIVIGAGIGSFQWLAGDERPASVAVSDTGDASAAARRVASCTPAQAEDPAWTVTPIAGSPRCGTKTMTAPTTLPVGGLIETDSKSSAEILVADIGRVVLSPNSRLALKKTASTEHRLRLDRGKLHAQIDAPPRLFLVETPTALAVDLGCEYTLEVGDDGETHLHVTFGYVALENGDKEVFVPAGYMSDALPGIGPTAPYSERSVGTFRAAVQQLARTPDDNQAFESVLAQASTTADTLTLWHLLAWGSETQCQRVSQRLRQLVGPPYADRADLGCGRSGAETNWRSVLEPLWELDEGEEEGTPTSKQPLRNSKGR